ncbi:MAG TPA: redoxin domain-containing protein [Chthoniobacteraceae bacterium]|jgi:mono/diheme cytochrome c family protein|nr:redoxin domain-containing protein [Chthoniobacteraceae bacterium]
MMRTLSLSSLAALVSLTALHAAPSRDFVEQKFKELDKNHDGVVTADELPDAALFKRVDRDGDGRITLDEVLAAAAAQAQAAGGPSVTLPAPAGPHPLSASQAGLGRRIEDLRLTDLNGRTLPLFQALGRNGAVIAFTGTTCPVSKRYAPGLARLEVLLRGKGIALVVVDPFASDAPGELRSTMKDLGVTSPVVHDRAGAVVRALQGGSSSEVFLIDATRTLRYRGAQDDQYGLNYSQDAPKHTYLLDAVEEMLAGRKVSIAAVSAPGCELETAVAEGKATTSITYHGEVERILQQNCAECHHEGGIGPFSLETLGGVRERARTIKRVVEQGIMPPWFAAPEAAGRPSPWANDRSLSTDAKQTLLAWLDSKDRPEGNAGEAPKPIQWLTDWTLGEPDAVFGFAQPMAVKAEGTMGYVNVEVPTHLTEDRWVTAVQVLPGARDVVHHVGVFITKDGTKMDGGGLNYLALYVPGTAAEQFPAGMAKKLPAGSTLKFQMHYTPNGRATTDSTRIGLYFAKEPPQWEVRSAAAVNSKINIPPGEPNYELSAEVTLPPNVLILGFFPHMHLRGKAFRYDLVQPDGSTRPLLNVPRYDFNWQLTYELATPMMSPSMGTRIRATAWYDNSAANKANPDPAKNVRFGEQTNEEMMGGVVKYAVPLQRPAETVQR